MYDRAATTGYMQGTLTMGQNLEKNSNNKMVSTNITYSVTILAIAYLVHWGIFIFV